MIRRLAAVAFVLASIGALLGCNDSDSDRDATLTSAEKKQIAEYARTVPVSEAIGQLFMVGLPADINTIRDSGNTEVERVVVQRQVGFVIPKPYTYFDDEKLAPDEYLSKIIDFNNAIQSKAAKSKLGLPVLFAADYEGPTITPVKRGLVTSPSALALGTTQDPKALFEVGALVGFQLWNIGIHILLGPVLDIHNVKQGTKNNLQERCFAASSEGVSRIASNYLSGVRQSGLLIFAKHYPSYGAVEADPHLKVIPHYEGAQEQRIRELAPYQENHHAIDGVMTSHVELDIGQNRKVATFSREIVDEVRKQGVSDKIVITDDLSNMGAIQKYMEATRATYADIAIQAFDAGHDVLLFAHVTRDDTGKLNSAFRPSSFRVKDLETVMTQLTKHIESTPAYKDQFRKSLERILRAKAKVAKQKHMAVASLLRHDNEDQSFHVPFDGKKSIDTTEIALENAIPSAVSNEPVPRPGIRDRIISNALRGSVVGIHEGKSIDWKLSELPSTSPITFAAYKGDILKFRDSFEAKFPNATFIAIPTTKNTAEFRNFEQKINGLFTTSARLVYSTYDESDADLLARLFRTHKRDFSSKVIILLHASPSILDSELIGVTSIVGNFTKHPVATDVDIEVLLSQVYPKGLENLPVNIGDNGKFYSVGNTHWMPPAKEMSPGLARTTEREKQNCTALLEEGHVVIQKKAWPTIVMKLVLLLFIPLGVIVIPAKYVAHANAAKESIAFQWRVMANRKVSFICAGILFAMLVPLLFDIDGAGDWIRTIGNFVDAIRKMLGKP